MDLKTIFAMFYVANFNFDDIYKSVNIPNSDISVNQTDQIAIAALISELNIARRNCRAYPKGHPVIAASLAKTLTAYNNLVNKHSGIAIAVSRDSLATEGVVFDKSNRVFSDFSTSLFERGIGLITFYTGATIEELSRLTVILGLRREQIQNNGGIENVWEKSQIKSIVIQPVRYDLLMDTDVGNTEPSSISLPQKENFWLRFARQVSDNNSNDHQDYDLDPEIVAEMFNRQYADNTLSDTDIAKSFGEFVSDKSLNMERTDFEKLSTFISTLSPELRRQFINSSFADISNDAYGNKAEKILTNLTDNALLETLEDINSHQLNLSSNVFGLLQRLGHNTASSRGLVNKSVDVTEDNNHLADKMKTILREHDSEQFVPDDYQKKLNLIISTDQLAKMSIEEESGLLETLDNIHVEHSIGQILINIIRDGIESPEERDLFIQNLSDMLGFYLQTGDYKQLHILIDQMNDNAFPEDMQIRLKEEYGRREFVDEVLDGLSVWGKPRFEDIRQVIHKIGSPFVEALLDRLSEEKNMSLRRFYIDNLIELGQVTRTPIANRLRDPRWYFLRNLLIILSAQNDATVVPLIQPLLYSDDVRLRLEAIKALLYFNDHHAEKQLAEEFEHHSQEIQSSALQLAEQCKTLTVASKLTSMLAQSGFTQAECDRKQQIIHILGEIGRAEVIPELAKILSSSSLLHSKALTKLKIEIIRTLPKYPLAVAKPVLERIASGSGETALLAKSLLSDLTRKNV